MRSLAIAGLLVTTACSAPASGLVLEGVISSDATCVLDVDAPLRADGIADTTPLAASVRPNGAAYFAALRVASYALPPTPRYPMFGLGGLAAERVVVEIRRGGHVVSLEASGLVNPFQVPAEGTLGYASNGTPNASVVGAFILPDAYVTALDATFGETEIEVSMYVVARAESGATRASSTLVFPLRLCLGCLLSCAPAGSAPSPSCVVGQDAPSTVLCD